MSAPVLSAEDLAEIEARANAATPGPWSAMSRGECGPGFFARGPTVGMEQASDDARFIAHAREDVPRLLAALAHMTARADAYRRHRNAIRVLNTYTERSQGMVLAEIECREAYELLLSLGGDP